METVEIWGRIYALIDHLMPGGLSAPALHNAVQAPGLYFGPHHIRIMRKLGRDENLLNRMTELVAGLSPDDLKVRYSVPEQGQFMLGFYAERSELPEERTGGAPGRPPKGSPQAVDWTLVDWSKSNPTLAAELGVSRQTVVSQRKRHGQAQEI